MALQPFTGLWFFFSFSWYYTQSTGFLGRGIIPSQSCYLHTEQHKYRINVHKHPCFEWDSNSRTQCSSKRRQFMLQTARPPWSARVGYRKNIPMLFPMPFRQRGWEGTNTVFLNAGTKQSRTNSFKLYWLLLRRKRLLKFIGWGRW
jgi:hypothetical protein